MKKLTQEEFISSCEVKHNFKYSYENVVYVNSRTKVEVTCPTHGSFLSKPNQHRMGTGCAKCGFEGAPKKKPNTTEMFLSEAIRVHGDRYDYSKVDYKEAKIKVTIICKDHGEFFVRPSDHRAGCGCPVCGRIAAKKSKTKTTARFIREAIEVHGEKFSYEHSEYKGAFDKVVVTCSVHGNFETAPNNFLSGRGCRQCASGTGGYDVNKQGTLYVLKNIDLVKVGITNNEVSKRIAQLNKKQMGFELVDQYNFEDGSIALALETKMLRYLRSKYTSPKSSFEGSSECFFNVDLEDLFKTLCEQIPCHSS